MTLEFSGSIWQWRGPAPYYFVTVPEAESQAIKAASRMLTYGWGMIPVTARIGDTEWKTAMFEKDGRYVLPLKVVVRRSEGLNEDDTVSVQLDVG